MDPESWFATYQDLDRSDGKSVIMPDGFERLCQALGFDMEGIEPMVLLWKLNGSELGTVEYSEWEAGIRDMGVRTDDALKAAIGKTLLQLSTDPAVFRAFYRRVFGYLQVGLQRYISSEYVMAVLPVLAPDNWVFQKFVEFLQANDRVKAVNRDQWQSLLELSRSLDQDLSNYSKDDAWPTLFDDFVDWMAKDGDEAAAS
ncbi:DCN1-like protein 5 [Coemansia sp. RSA 552]|nr:DCN1-like protein 5 [Coemansia sp. RSA 552]